MKHIRYDKRLARELLPLLESIGRELSERTRALEVLEPQVEEHSNRAVRDEHLLHTLVAEAATHRRGLRLARQELEKLGCTVVGTTPLTLRIPGRVGTSKQSFVWQAGDPVLR